MPKRPSKSKPAKSSTAKTGPTGGTLPTDRRSQEQHRAFSTKAILGKFQGRKSI